MKLIQVQVPSIQKPIQESPGFWKKKLADHKLDLMALCGFGCSYCSSNEGNYLRINRAKFAALTFEQTGQDLLPATDPGLTFTWPDVLEKLGAQLLGKPRSYGDGMTLVVSQLTDSFSPLALAPIDGGKSLVERALEMVLRLTSFRIRILTKSAVVGEPKWIAFFQRHPDRFTVGLSIGSLDDDWASRVEIGTSSPRARLKAHRALQDAGVPTFGMMCPIFPDVLQGDGLDRLVAAIRPELCEDVWAEGFNDRNNWRNVQAGYPVGSYGHGWFYEVYGENNRSGWSSYATALYLRLKAMAERDGWIDRMKYLLYEGDIRRDDAPAFDGFAGVLLQGTCTEIPVLDHDKKAIVIAEGPRKGQTKMISTGWSSNGWIRSLQRYEGHGFVKRGLSAPAPATSAA